MTAERDRYLDERYDLDLAMPVLRLLSGRTRVEILASLAEHDADVNGIADRIGLDMKSISHQLRQLRASHLVSYSPDKQHHVYQLNGTIKITFNRDMFELRITPAHGCVVMLQVPHRA